MGIKPVDYVDMLLRNLSGCLGCALVPTQGKDAIMAPRDHLGSGGKRAPTMSLA